MALCLTELPTPQVSGRFRKGVYLSQNEIGGDFSLAYRPTIAVWQACVKAKVEPWTADVTAELDAEGIDPADWVIDQNKYRRHLTKSQLACVSTKYLEYLEKVGHAKMGAAGGKSSKTSGKNKVAQQLRNLKTHRSTDRAAKKGPPPNMGCPVAQQDDFALVAHGLRKITSSTRCKSTRAKKRDDTPLRGPAGVPEKAPRKPRTGPLLFQRNKTHYSGPFTLSRAI